MRRVRAPLFAIAFYVYYESATPTFFLARPNIFPNFFAHLYFAHHSKPVFMAHQSLTICYRRWVILGYLPHRCISCCA